MKYSCSTMIDGPRGAVTALFDDVDNLKKWQDGLQVFERISGAHGEVGSKYRILYQMGKREVEMIETLEHYNLPEQMTAIYEAKGVWNRNDNRFADLGDTTRWDLDCEFRCSGFLRVVAFLMPGMFKKQTQKMMADFKTFAEAEL